LEAVKMPHYELHLEIFAEMDIDEVKEMIGEIARDYELEMEGTVILKGKRVDLEVEYITVE
jgi:ATP-dependent RNA circularization protein (DNA/RNA ligase family)